MRYQQWTMAKIVWLIFNTLLELKNVTSLNVRLNFQLKYISYYYR